METIDDILREMRDYATIVRNATDGCDPDVTDNTACGIIHLADRIDAAHRAEHIISDKVKKFVDIVVAMRNAQKCFFSTHSVQSLKDSIRLEHDVDALAKDVLNPYTQEELF